MAAIKTSSFIHFFQTGLLIDKDLIFINFDIDGRFQEELYLCADRTNECVKLIFVNQELKKLAKDSKTRSLMIFFLADPS